MKRALLYPMMLVLACGMAVGQSGYKVLYTFGNNGPKDGSSPNAGLLYRAGEAYGTTQYGGTYCYSETGSGCGTVFALGHFYENVVEAVIYNFCTTGDPRTCADGAIPYGGGLAADEAGNLYGTTLYGGLAVCSGPTYGTCGTVFQLTRVSKNTWNETVIHSFNGLDGMSPFGGVVFDKLGNLYGTTSSGGAYGGGTVYELSPNPDGTWSQITLHDFNPAGGDGNAPVAVPVFDLSGNLYGTTEVGGDTNCLQGIGCGTVYQLSPNPDGTWSESIIHRFGTKLAIPESSLTLDKNGNLYGTAIQGGVFRLIHTDGGWKENAFLFADQGSQPSAPVSLWRGAVYGTTYLGGSGLGGSGGTIFKIQGGTETVLYNFCSQPLCEDGANPYLGGPLLIVDGSLYGTALDGGNGRTNVGVIFEFTP